MIKSKFLINAICAIVVTISLCLSSNLYAQVNIGNDALVDTSAVLQLTSTNKGLLIPILTTAQQNNIPLPATGLIIFNKDLNSLSLNTGTPLAPVWGIVKFNALVYSGNGLRTVLDSVLLGGTLNTPTTIVTSSSNTLAFTGLQSGFSTDSLVVVDPNTGVLRRRSFSSFLKTSNGLSQNGDTVLLGGVLNRPTVIITSPTATLSIANLNLSVNNADSFFLVQNSNGVLSQRVLVGTNGISKVNGAQFILGGNLTAPTTIGTNATNTLAITGLQSGNRTDSLVVINPVTGVLQKMSLSAAILAQNGLSKSIDTVLLGGALTQPTTITTSATNTLSITNLNTSTNTADSFYVVQNASGTLSKRYLKATNGLTKAAADSLVLGGTLNIPTTIATSPVNTLSITGLQSGNPTDSVVVVNGTTGLLRYRNAQSIVKTSNGLTKNGDTVLLSGTLNRPTTFATSAQNTMSITGLQNATTTDTLLVLSGNGTLQTRKLTTLTNANNGLSKTLGVNGGADTVVLGGTLKVPTTITTSSTNTLSLTGLQQGATADSFFVIQNATDGKLKKTYLKVSNGLTKAGADSIRLGGTLNAPTILGTSASNTLAITGLQSGTASDSVVVAGAVTGTLRMRSASSVVNATNGVSKSADTVLLGGNLNRPTTIATSATNTLGITNLQNGGNQDSFFVVQNVNGSLSNRTLKGANGLTKVAPDSIILGGTLNTPTTIVSSSTNTLSVQGLPNSTTADSVVFIKGNGQLVTRTLNTLTNVSNGVSKNLGTNGSADTVVLGGTLVVPNTTITTSPSNTLTISNLQPGGFADSFFVSQNSFGKLTNRTLKVANGLTKNAADSFSLGGALNQPTTISTSATNTLGITGLQSGTANDSVVVVGSTNGTLRQRAFSAIVNVTNGISKNLDTVLLNGSLNRPTTLSTDPVNTLSISNLSLGVSSVNQPDSFFVTQNADGVLTKRALKLTNGLTKIGPDSFNFGGTLITPTTLNTSATNTLAVQGLQNGTNDTIVIVNNGVLQTRKLSTVFSTANGVSKKLGTSGEGDTVILGGSLTQATSIVTSPTNTLSIENLSTGVDGDSLFVVQNTNGKLSQRSLKALNGVSKIGVDSFVLGGSLAYPTTINTNATNSLSINGLQAGTKKDTFVVLNNGVLRTRVTTTLLDTALNGLSVSNDSVLLGGTLTQATTINTSATNSLSINGLQAGTKKDTFVVLNNGVLRTRVTTTLLDTALNGLTVQNDSVLLGGTLTQATALNTTATNTLSINGLQDGLNSDTFVVMRNGILKTRVQSTIVDTALNGLTKQSDSVKLGGSLTQPTVIATNSVNTIALTGLQPGLNSDTFLVMRNGVVKTRTQSSIVDTALNGLTKNNDSIILGGTLNRPTSIVTSATNTLSIQGLQNTGGTDSFVTINNGVLTARAATSILDTALNGLTKIADTVKLGGSLTQPTVVTTSATNTFALQGLQAGLNTDTFVVLNNGVLKTRLASKVLDTALNGLTKNLDTVKLGGSLTQPTVITTSATNTFALQGLQAGLNTDTFVVLNNGVLKTRLASKVLDTALNGLTKNLDTVKLGGSLTQPTVITASATNTFALQGLQAGLNTDTFVVLNNGVLKTRLASKVLDTALNGLTKNLDTVKLGGSLTQPTVITTSATNTFALQGLQAGLNTDTFVVLNNGVLKTRLASKVLDTALNGLTKNLDTVKLGGSLTQPTVINTSATNTFALQGLQAGLNTDTFVVLNNGVLKTRLASKVLDTALNGLTKNLDTVKLGGSLTQPTVITTSATNTFALQGLQAGLNTDTFVVLNNGVLKTRLASKILDTATNGLSRSADTVTLGGTLIKPTTIATSATNTLAITGLQPATTSDSALFVSNTGTLQYRRLNTFFVSTSGISRVASAVQGQPDTFVLGGQLNRAATITTNAQLQDSLSITGLNLASAADTFFITENLNGKLSRTSLSSVIGNAWVLSGNNAPTNSFLGTTNAVPLLFKVNNLNAAYLSYDNSTANNGQSVFWGLGAGNIANTTAAYGNTGIGVYALDSLTTGRNNVALGYSALISDTSGSNNVAIGASALSLNKAGSNNIAVGSSALTNNVSGTNNLGVGTNALFAVTNANNNVAIGNYSLSASTGNSNTAVGYQSLNSVVVGDSNVALGNNAGSNLVSGSNNIFIGYNTSAPSSTGSNQLNIGNLIYGTGLNGTVASPQGNIGIGVTNPTNRLHVSATADPLRLGGLVSTSVRYDSVLTATSDSGIVRYLSLNNNVWKTSGNTLASNPNAFLGSRDNNPLKLATNDTVRMTLASNGYVGIGTTNPSQLVHVTSARTSTTDSNFVITTAGFVGIGTTAPTNALTVSAPANPLRLRGLQYSATGSDTVLYVNSTGVVGATSVSARVWSLSGNSTAPTALPYLGTITNNSLRIKTNSVTRMIIDSLGRVGIGDTTPQNLFSVKDNPSGKYFVVTSGGYVGVGLTAPTQALEVAGASDTIVVTSAGRIGVNTINPVAPLHVVTKLGGINNIVISDSGRLGIGTTKPLQGIQVSGTAAAGDTVVITNTGRIGIGTAYPTNALHVVATANPVRLEGVQLSTSDSGLVINGNGVVGYRSISALSQTAWGITGNGGTTSTSFLGTTDNQPLRISTNSSTRMTILPTGYVGIGTTLPQQLFQVMDTTIKVPMVFSSSGLLGIGTTAPITPIHVLQNPANAILATFQDTVAAASGAYIAFSTANNSANGFQVGMGTNLGDKSSFVIQGNVGGNTYQDFVTISPEGNVGIGNDTPKYQLDVKAVTNPIRILGLSVGSATDSIITINQDGVLRQLSPSSLIYNAAWNLNGNAGINSTNFLGTTDNNPLNIRTNNANRLSIATNGFVGIGTTAPNQLLQVQGGTTNSVDSAVVITGNGRVGIANTNPLGTIAIKNFNLYDEPYSLSWNENIDIGNSGTTGYNMSSSSASSNVALSLSVYGSTKSAYFGYNGDTAYFGNGSNLGGFIWKNNVPRGSNVNNASVGNTLMTLTNTGYLGLGTTRPQQALQVSGALVAGDTVVITNTGRIGIGTTNPLAPLHIKSANPMMLSGLASGSSDSVLVISGTGTVGFRTAASLLNAWNLAGNSNTNSSTDFLGTTDNRSLVFRTNGTRRMVLDSNGVLLIGSNYTYNNPPGGPPALVIGSTPVWNVPTSNGNSGLYFGQNGGNAGSSNQEWITFYGTGSQQRVVLALTQASTSYGNVVIAADAQNTYFAAEQLAGGTNGFIWKNNVQSGNSIISTGNELMRLTYSGNLGIGTSAPSTRLSIVAPNGVNPIYVTGMQSGNSTDSIVTYNPTTYFIRRVSPTVYFNTQYWTPSGNTGTNPATNFLGTTDANALNIRTNNTIRLTVASNGNVGIGTTNPQQIFHVQGTAGTAATAVVVNSLGYLGLGTTNPLAPLDVQGLFKAYPSNYGFSWNDNNAAFGTATRTNYHFSSQSSTANSVLSLSNMSGTKQGYVGFNGDSLIFGSTNTSTGGAFIWKKGVTNNGSVVSTGSTLMVLDSAGRLGLGTSQPQQLLQVSGGLVANDSITMTSTGRLGIGTTNPLYTLDIQPASGTSPLRLTGLASGTSDSALVVSGAGIVGWRSIAQQTNAWLLGGNTISSGNFLGTTNNQNFVIRANNNTVLQAIAGGGVLIGSGTFNANSILQLNSFSLYNPGNTLGFGENFDPTFGSTIESAYHFTSTASTRNVILSFAKTNAQTAFLGNNGSDFYLMDEGTSNTQGNFIFKFGVTLPSPFTTGSEVMRVTNTGRLGIATTAPAAVLDINASAYPGANVLRITGLPNTLLSTDSLLVIDNTGDVKAVAQSNFAINYWSTTGNSGTNATNFIGTNDANPLSFVTNRINRMVLTLTGGVGIGTNAPTQLLHVQGGSTANPDSAIVFTSAGYLGVGLTNPTAPLSFKFFNAYPQTNSISWNENVDYGNANQTNFHISSQSASKNIVLSMSKQSGSATALASIGFNGSNVYFGNAQNTVTSSFIWKNNVTSGSDITANGTTLMTLNNTGLGIGTTSPTQALQVSSTLAAGDTVVITNTGRIGIGTTNPLYALDIQAPSNPIRIANLPSYSGDSVLVADGSGVLYYRSLGGLTSAWLRSGNVGTNPGSNFIGTTDNNNLRIKTNSTDRIFISGTAGTPNIGIGTTAPAANTVLDILATNHVVVTDAGYFGIGTTAPNTLLNVVGNPSQGVLAYLQNTGTGNTFMQFTAGTNNFGVGMGLSNGTNQNAFVINAGKSQGFAGVDVLTILPSGNIGIGTTAPTNLLHVVGSGTDPVRLQGLLTGSLATDNVVTVSPTGVLRSVAINNLYWQLGGNANIIAGQYLGTTNAQNLTFVTNGIPRITVSALGAIGVNTTNPNSNNLFEVAGSAGTFNVTNSGNITIGSYDPVLSNIPLYINAVTAGSWNTQRTYFDYTSGSSTLSTDNSGAGNISLYATGRIVSQTGVVAVTLTTASDKRIKNIQGLSNPLSDLNTLNKIQITNYKLKDTILFGNRVFKKVIAQQLQDVYPNAVDLSKNFIPNIYQLVSHISVVNDSTYNISFAKPADVLKDNTTLKLVNNSNREVLVRLARIISPTELQVVVDKDLTHDQYFAYGQQVNDFRTVDYDALTALNTSAIQELSKQIDDKNKEISQLKRMNDEQTQRIDRLEKLLEELLQKK